MKLPFRHFTLITMILGSIAMAQVSVGTPPFGSFGGGPFDTINLGNLNVHFAIPVLHKAGRGLTFYYDLTYESSIWYPGTVNGTTQWVPTQSWGWMPNTLAVIGYLSTKTTYTTFSGKICSNGQFGTKTTYTTTYAYVDSKTASHPFPGSTLEYVLSGGCSGTTYGSTLTATATDGSGWTLYAPATQLGTTVTTRSGIIVATNVYNPNSGSGWYQDTNGNQLTAHSNGQYYDTLSSTTPVLTLAGSGTPSSPVTYTYSAPSGSTSYQVNYTQYTVATDFAVSGITEYAPTSTPLVSSIQLPDGSEYSITYEATPGSCSPLAGTSECVTGRIASVTLPTGGQISYTYGVIYKDGSTAGLTRALTATTIAPAESWSYTRAIVSGTPGPGSTWTTTVVDPGGNNSVINFAEDAATNTPTSGLATYNFYETQRKVYQGNVSSNPCSSTNPTNCFLLTTTGCYNANYSSCATSTVTSPITQTDYYAQPAGGQSRLSQTLYNGYGLVTDDKEYDYGATTGSAPGTTKLIRETSIAYAVLGNSIVDRPSSVYVYDWSSGSQVTVSDTGYGWDAGTPTSTTNTPQHVSITGARGNMTSALAYISGTTHLTKTFTYYDTGNVNVATDVNGAQATYTYGGCGNSFPTSISEPLSLTRSMVWNCTGAVTTQVTDENNNNTTSTYTDPAFWRPFGVTDQMGITTAFYYQPNATYPYPAAYESSLSFNNNNSIAGTLNYFDGFGRPLDSQVLQAPGGSNFDTLSYSYDANGRVYSTSMPCVGSYVATCPSSPATTQTYDALNRPLITTDGGGGTVSYTYTNNDALQQVSGSQTFKKQFEYDGLGRLSSVCEISTTLPGTGACGQNVSQTGYLTKYTYDALGRMLKVTQNAQPGGTTQTRSFVYDWLGRMTSESNPETGNQGTNGTTTYAFDSSSNCGGVPIIGCGDLAHKTDNAGNITNYTYDALHRVLTAGNSGISGATLRDFCYDSATGTPPTGWTGTSANPKVHLIEAKTTNTSGTTQTDEWFEYDADGRLTDVFESTPNHSSYYHTTTNYWATGAPETLSGIPSVPTIYYGTNASGGNFLDGEGRYLAVNAASGTTPASNIVYSTSSTSNVLGALSGITYGSSDSDSFTFDPNTGRAATNIFTVNGNTDTGTLTWNTNGTLQQLAIVDHIPSTADTETCAYAYDDLSRVAGSGGTPGVKCTNGSTTLWSQSFSYDAFGNITKSGSGAFTPSYTFSNNAVTNQFYSIPGVTVRYDTNGNLLTDNLNTYTWDPNWGNMLSVNTGAVTVNAIYDALGRMVQQQNGSTYTEILYSPLGKTALMNGSTLVKAFVPLPGGGTAIYNSSGLAYYRHADWLGSSRLTSTQARGLYSSVAYAPFGEQYTQAGTADPSFTGQNSDSVASLYDFALREHSMSQGRWISPDPAGMAAADARTPQTWNRYAYVASNPLSFTDPLGLQLKGPGNTCVGDTGGVVCASGSGGGGGVDGGGDDSSGVGSGGVGSFIDASGSSLGIATNPDGNGSDPSNPYGYVGGTTNFGPIVLNDPVTLNDGTIISNTLQFGAAAFKSDYQNYLTQVATERDPSGEPLLSSSGQPLIDYQYLAFLKASAPTLSPYSPLPGTNGQPGKSPKQCLVFPTPSCIKKPPNPLSLQFLAMENPTMQFWDMWGQ